MDKAELSSCFGQVICGPPGSGKSTYTREAFRLLKETRSPVLVNLDPALIGAQAKEWRGLDVIDIRNLITCEDASKAARGIGPNASFLFCLEYLNSTVGREWLVGELRKQKANAYFIFDLPGQVELVTHHLAVRQVLHYLVQEHELRLVAVHLVDGTFAMDALKFMSVSMLCLSTMMCLELPHLNVLTKSDLVANDALDFPLEFYTANPNFTLLAQSKFLKVPKRNVKYKALCDSVCEMLDNYAQVAFHMVSVRDDEQSVRDLLQACDVACGWRC